MVACETNEMKNTDNKKKSMFVALKDGSIFSKFKHKELLIELVFTLLIAIIMILFIIYFT